MIMIGSMMILGLLVGGSISIHSIVVLHNMITYLLFGFDGSVINPFYSTMINKNTCRLQKGSISCDLSSGIYSEYCGVKEILKGLFDLLL